MAIDAGRMHELLGRCVADMGGAVQAVHALIGDRLGLYRSLDAVMPATPAEVAAHAGVDERQLGEWLNCQAAGGYISYDPATGRYSLTEEQAFALAAPDGMEIASGFFVAIAAALNIERITEAFRSGAGVAWHEQDPLLFEGTERFFRPGYTMNLVSDWIPALDGVEARLRTGGRVADVGCGHGASTLLLARSFPAAQVTGFDYHEPSVRQAAKRAADAGLTANIGFEVATAADFPGADYDLVTIFDALHDLPDPLTAARHIRSALAPDGTFLLVEPYAGDAPQDNFTPLGRLGYGVSAVICVPHAMTAEPRTALGAQAGEARLTALLTEAGFSRVRRAAETPVNLVLEARP